MSLKEIAKAIDKTGKYSPHPGFDVAVKVVDARQAYGRTDYLVTPISGGGQTWISAQAFKADKA